MRTFLKILKTIYFISQANYVSLLVGQYKYIESWDFNVTKHEKKCLRSISSFGRHCESDGIISVEQLRSSF